MCKWIRNIGIRILTGAFIMATLQVQSQDIQYSQFYANVLYLNPAFAGNAHALRGMFHQRVQWPALDAKYITSHFSVDNYFKKANSGIGMYVYKDWQGSNTISTVEGAFQYAYELPLSPKLSVRAGIQAGYISRYLNYSILKFPDQYNDRGWIGKNSGQPFGSENVQYWDFTSGAIVYTDQLWFGLTFAHMNEPKQSFYDNGSPLPQKFDFITGYRIDFSKKDPTRELNQGRDIYVTPTAHYKLQGKSDQIDLGVYVLYDHLITGFWYRGIPILKHYRRSLQNNESFVALIGWRVNNLSISYSYDFTLSKLAPARTGGSHELNITYLYNLTTKKKKRMRRIPCPNFYK